MSETWRYEIRGSSLYDLTEDRPLSLAEAGELLNAHQHLLITSSLWAGKAGLAEQKLTATEGKLADVTAERDAWRNMAAHAEVLLDRASNMSRTQVTKF